MRKQVSIPMDMINKQRQQQQATEPPQLTRVRRLYTAIEAMKPKEGRDYRVLLRSEGDITTVRVEGITPLGLAFADSCQKNMTAALLELTGAENESRVIRVSEPTPSAGHTDTTSGTGEDTAASSDNGSDREESVF